LHSPIHIISFDIPYPPNYGGVIDVYYKLQALHDLGVPIVLHCFQYGEGIPSVELERVTANVYYYQRSRHFYHILSTTPFIVLSRRLPDLIRNLENDDYPVLFEGLHCAGFIDHPALANRPKWVRMHNVEWQYYRNLSKLEKNTIKKTFFYQESLKLLQFEKRVLKHADKVFTISPNDQGYYEKRHPDVMLIPPFHGLHEVNSKLGKGNYALFHGKLSVMDNEHSAIFLVKEVFSHLDYPLVIAGLNPSERLQKLCARHSNIELRPNLSTEAMKELIANAHIHLLFTRITDGMKLKLLYSLFDGRHCIANEKMVLKTGLKPLCHMAETGLEVRKKILELIRLSFNEKEVEHRRQLLFPAYSDIENARKLLE